MAGKRNYHLDKVGKRFGYLTFQGMTEEIHPSASRYLGKFLCDCGNISLVLPRTVFIGETKSCGCYRKELAHDPEMIKHRMMGQHQAGNLSATNKSGIKNIFKRSGSEKFQLKLTFNGQVYLESFTTLTDAVNARNLLYKSLGLEIPKH